MRILRRALVAMAVLAGALPCAESAPGFLPLDEITPGETARTRTVLEGTEIREFDVEIVSVIRKVGPDSDLIVARVLAEDLARLGVPQGMSGSPVYVDGRLIGAVSSTWPFAREPLFGITPAGQMEREARQELDARPGAAAEDLGAAHDFLEGRPPPAPEVGKLRPIGSPMVLSGFDRRLVDLAAETFGPWGFTVSEGGAAGGEQRGGPIEPGATLGVRLAGGDADVTAFGTVTWVDGDRVHGWGHPLLQMGAVEMPLVNGFVHAVVPSQAISFKLASGGDIVGTCTGDRRSGIFGRLGRAPRLTEFEIAVTRSGETRRFRYEVVRNRFLAPSLIGLTAGNSLLAGSGLVAEETVRFRQRIVLADGRETTVETLFSGDRTLPQIVQLLSEATKAIATNPFEDVEIERIDAELRYEPGIRIALLMKLTVDDDTLEPGDVLCGSYTLRDYRGEERAHRFALPLPADAREGRYLLLAADAPTAEQYEAERDPRSFAPRSLDEYLERLRRLRQSDEVHLHLYRQSRGLLVEGRPLADLPPSALSVMRGPARSGTEENLPAELVLEERVPAGRFVAGAHDVLLEIRRENP